MSAAVLDSLWTKLPYLAGCWQPLQLYSENIWNLVKKCVMFEVLTYSACNCYRM